MHWENKKDSRLLTKGNWVLNRFKLLSIGTITFGSILSRICAIHF